MPDGYLSSGQLATLIGRSRDTVRRYEALGLIPVGRRDPINGRRYWPSDQAEAIRQRLRPVAVDVKPDDGTQR
jgi:DNA-binding transcriptional MerR regulator